MRAWLLLAALLLAGCADPPPPLTVGEPVLGEGTPPDFAGSPALEYRSLASSQFTIAPTQQFLLPVTIPNGTIAVYANLTLNTGVVYGLIVQLGGCSWTRDYAFVASGQDLVIDCGGVLDGAETLRLDAKSGTMQGDVEVVALICTPLGGCPGRLPIGG